jgi:hypothetical protein
MVVELFGERKKGAFPRVPHSGPIVKLKRGLKRVRS